MEKKLYLNLRLLYFFLFFVCALAEAGVVKQNTFGRKKKTDIEISFSKARQCFQFNTFSSQPHSGPTVYTPVLCVVQNDIYKTKNICSSEVL